MNIETASYLDQTKHWPPDGRHILAQFDDESIVVYQAYRRSIGLYTIEHGCFGGGFSLSRMSWIKPNFLWMMYRCGWGTKEGQEVILALRIRREFFDRILAQAVQSSYYEGHFASRELWQVALTASSVRLQWDPDHDPTGTKLTRRAIQLGLRGDVLEAFSSRELLEVIDMTEFVAQQRPHASTAMIFKLRTPVEQIYVPSDTTIAKRLGLDTVNHIVQGANEQTGD